MRAEKASGVLARLLGARGAKRFLENHWPHHTFLFHGARKRLGGLTDIPELESVESLLCCPADRLMVQNDHRTLVCKSRDEARELYDWGYQIYWDNIQPESASFAASLRGLEDELGLPRGLVRCNAFACSRECTTVPGFHFDYGEGFTIQVRGKKRWRYLGNRHVRYPDFTYMLGEWVEPDKKHFFSRGAPERLPVGKSVVMKPGSVLFLPRGAWHTTVPIGASLHIDIDVETPTWGTVILQALERELIREERWREPIDTHSRQRTENAEERLRELLDELSGRVGRFDARRTLKRAGLESNA